MPEFENFKVDYNKKESELLERKRMLFDELEEVNRELKNIEKLRNLGLLK